MVTIIIGLNERKPRTFNKYKHKREDHHKKILGIIVMRLTSMVEMVKKMYGKTALEQKKTTMFEQRKDDQKGKEG